MGIFSKYESMHILRNESGFTLVETIVAISISFIVIGLGYMVFYNFQKNYFSWKEREKFVRQNHMINKILYNDLIHANKVLSLNNNKIEFVGNNKKLIKYELINNRIYRNNRALNDSLMPVKMLYFSTEFSEFKLHDSFNPVDYLTVVTTDSGYVNTDSTCIKQLLYYFEMDSNTKQNIASYLYVNLRNRVY